MDNNYAVEGSGVTDGQNADQEADSDQHYTIHNHFEAYHGDNSGHDYSTTRFRNDDGPWTSGVPAQTETGSNRRSTHVPTSPTGGTQGSEDDAHLADHDEKKDMERKKKHKKQKKDGGSTVTNKDAKGKPKKDGKDDASKKGDRGNKGRNHAHGQRA